ncbi:hypothetical protein MCOR25_001848 [Pyricularia grisea]|uniref:Uncharacterized protein n=1 Tax=Pyricularia grisea TaxID=148305 RepID=A0A6P8BA61_PYRGI|nr:uncharacterized protein PgNI_03680 [Pyricularia grisea]KAI6379950.1 hypothetical protein MCOR25_001848 [Pyricularia grisea]TLD12699.1 hypothetical protein PgNI_03680 [Pyricularia grisea]
MHAYLLKSRRQNLWAAMASSMSPRGKLLEDLSNSPEGCKSLSMLHYELVEAASDIDTTLAARALTSMSRTVQAKPLSPHKNASSRPRRQLPSFPGEYVQGR